jgi:hypothetical protein
VAPTLARRLEKMRGKAISTAALKASAAYLAAAGEPGAHPSA